MKSRWHIENIALIVVAAGMAGIFLVLLTTGKISTYIHPRLNVYVLLAAIILLAIAFFNLPHIKHPKHSVYLRPYCFFVIPFLAVLMLPQINGDSITTPLSTDTLTKNMGPKEYTNKKEKTETATSGENEAVKKEDQEMGKNDQQKADNALAGNDQEAAKDNSIETEKEQNELQFKDGAVIADDDFGHWIVDVTEHMADYEGMEVTVKGEVFRDQTLAEDEFVPMREVMVCCAADLQGYGFIARGEEASKWKDGSWVNVTGKIKIETIDGQDTPVIMIEKVTEAEAPVNEYVYFY